MPAASAHPGRGGGADRGAVGRRACVPARQRLIHRDIKPSNVLFVQGHARIADPGLVAAIEASQSLRGTLGYMAPEGPGTPKADLFGLGKLLYVISTGKAPGEFPLLPLDMTSYPDAAD